MRRYVLIAVAAMLVAGGVWGLHGRAVAPAPAAHMRTATVTRGTLAISVSATGTLQPYSQIEVRSRATGTVVDVRAQEGDRVARGQLLVVIDDRDARAQVATAQAQFAAAQARWDQARRQLALAQAQDAARIAEAEAALAGARARLAQVEAGERPEQLAQAREAVRQAGVQADLAQQTLERTRALYHDGFVPRAQLEQAQSQHDVAQAGLRQAQARLRELEAGSRPEEVAIARTQVQQAGAALQQARAAVLQERVLETEVAAAAAGMRGAAAQLAAARDRLDETRITAPIAGMVARRFVQVGQTVIGGLTGGGTLVMTIADLRQLQATVNVDESDVARIRVGMPVAVTADALPGRRLAGRVARIAPQAMVVQNVTQYEVVVALVAPDPSLRLGMTVDAEFQVLVREHVLLVPAGAVRGTDTRVVVVVEGETLRPVPVEVGATDGRQVEIVRGLRAGQVVSLGPARQPAGGASPQQVNPFLPQFRRPTGR
ncbi:MAG: efflux RND transporter periplasmic adaptor subunit [Armatimonadota bacterium]|nr:efflux RND transporter periplasmic adaptor subunit [Armatimonadota bacterium]